MLLDFFPIDVVFSVFPSFLLLLVLELMTGIGDGGVTRLRGEISVHSVVASIDPPLGDGARSHRVSCFDLSRNSSDRVG